jgi:hypothetical protein
MTAKAGYSGSNRQGVAVMGFLPADEVAQFVERRYRQGWRALSVNCDGREVGAIERLPFHRTRRLWWAEEVSK